MAIPSYEGIAYNTAFASSNTVDISGIDGGSPPTVGDLLLAEICLPNANPNVDEFIYPPDGWHIIGGYANASRNVVFWKIRESGDSNSIQFSYPGIGTLNSIAYIHCIRGVDKARPIARHSINYEDSGTYNWLAETTPVADCLAIASANLVEGNLTGASPASGWTERLDVGIGVLLDEVTCYVQTKGISSASTSTGNPSTDIPGIASYAYTAHMYLIQPTQTATPKDIRVATGTFASPTSTGNQDITGLGFDCKALIIYGIRNNGSAVTDIEYTHGIGADDGVTSAAQRSFGVWHDSGSGAAGYSRNGEIIALYIAGNSTLGSPNLLATYSRITDGFRLNWSAVMGSGYAFSYIAFGGSDFRAACGAVQCSSGSVSGLNFRPDAVHIIGQCLDSDSDQIRTVAGIGNCGWLDCQAGGQFYSFIGTEETGSPDFIYRHSGIYGQTSSGTANYEISFEQTSSSGWSWVGTDSDYLFYLALYFGGTTYFPYQVENLVADNSGTAGIDQDLPSFGLDQTYGTKKLIHALTNRDGTDVGTETGGCSEGHVKFSYEAVDQDGMAIAKTGSTSERRRATFQAILMHSSGDLDSTGKLGRFYYPDYIDWQVNNTVDHLIGLFTLGFIGQVYTRTVANDTISVSDSLDVEMFYGRTTVSDNISVTDSIQREHDAHRIITDTVSVTDQIQREHDAVRTIDDTVSVTDQAYTNLEYERSLSDTVSVVDFIQREHDAVRTISDTVSVNDSLSVELSYERSLSDTVSVTDSIQRKHDAVRIITDTVSVSDQAYTNLEYERSLSDTVSVTDQIQRAHDAVRTIDDTVSVTDQIQRAHDAHRIISDSVSVTDQIQRVHDASRTINDSVSVTDQIQRAHDAHRIISDSIEVADSIEVQVSLRIFISDNIYVTDQIQRVHDAVRTINDSIAVTDSIVRNMNFERSVSDTVNVTDQLVVEFFIERTVSDSISVTDKLSRDHDSSRTFDDNVSVTDQIAIEVFRENVDSISVVDQILTELVYSRTISDIAVVTDSIKARLEYERSFSDSISVSDSLSVELYHGRIVSDSVSVTDSIQREHDAHRIISDIVSITDQIVPEVFRRYGDMVGVIDELKVSLVYERKFYDYVVTYDTFRRGKEIGYTISDIANVTDQISTEMNFSRTIDDTVSVSDQLIVEFEEGQIKRQFYETIGVTDSLSVEMQYGRTVSDSVNVSDQIAIAYGTGITINDSISVTDQLVRSQEVSIVINDSINVSDQASAGIFDYTLSDSISLSDSLLVEMEYERTVSDTVSTSDQIVSQITGEINVTINDTISVTDSIQREHNTVRTISDTISVSDSLTATNERSISDSVSVSDQLIAETSYNRTVNDTVNVADQIQREHDANRSITDLIQVDDTISVSTGGIILLSDSVNIVEELLVEMEYGRTISETISVTDQTSALAERIFDIIINDSVNVSETFFSEVEYHRIISDSVIVSDLLSVFTPSLDVHIDDSISIEDLIIVALEKAKTIFDSIEVSDQIESELTLGAYVSDTISVVDQIIVDLIFTEPDEVEVVDLLIVEVYYSRTINDGVEVEDSVIEGAQILVIHSIEDGTNYGPLQIHTVSPTGPLSISGGRDCYPIPTGFVIIKGDYVECNDRLDVGMVFEQTINDSIEVTG